jgi:hypothetical protein
LLKIKLEIDAGFIQSPIIRVDVFDTGDRDGDECDMGAASG